MTTKLALTSKKSLLKDTRGAEFVQILVGIMLALGCIAAGVVIKDKIKEKSDAHGDAIVGISSASE